jgi:death-on-curing protein
MKEPKWVSHITILRIHDAQVAEHGGGPGVRDMGLLQSAIDHPRNLFAYNQPSIFDLAAAYAERIVKNHPFIDGNKRTALVTCLLFLKMNGYEFRADRIDIISNMVMLASSQMTIDGFAGWLAKNSFKTEC